MISCPSCHRRHLPREPESHREQRCLCGHLLVPATVAGAAVPGLECAVCGGPIAEDREACSYCSTRFEISPASMALRCSRCFQRLPDQSRFCNQCGNRVEPQWLITLDSEVRCPRCRDRLDARQIAEATVLECLACEGLWMSPRCFERLCVHSEGRTAAARELFLIADAPAPVEEAVRYLPCLVCRDFMSRKNYALRSGIIIDVCRRHGVWLDHGEAHRLIEYIGRNGLAHPPLG